MHRVRITSALLGLLIASVALPGASPEVEARGSTSARTSGEIYERKETIAGCLELVAGDLKVRSEKSRSKDPPVLLLVVDPTVSLRREIAVIQRELPLIWRHGPRTLRVAVIGAGSETVQEPTAVDRNIKNALEALAYVSNPKPKNMHAAIRRGAELLEDAGSGAKSMLLITEEGGEVEDDVEDTRTALFRADCSFYCIAPESAFEWPWTQPFDARPSWTAAGYEERLTPDERKGAKGSLFFGSEVAYGLVPYRWEHNLAQSDFIWVRPPRYPVPSGFGYWSLATLSYSTGGRYFVFDFGAAALAARGKKRKKPMYNFSRMAGLAPDLRPRKKVLKSLNRDFRSQAVIRIWQDLADEAFPIIQTRGTLERRGTRLLPRPRRALRSATNPRRWLTDLDEVREEIQRVKERLRRIDQALVVWSKANAKERAPDKSRLELEARIEADFQLLGVQLKQVRFQWGEVLATLKSIEPLDVSYRRVRIMPRRLLIGFAEPDPALLPQSPERKARFADFRLAQKDLAAKYVGTPWSLLMEKALVYVFRKDIHIIEPEPERPTPPTGSGQGDPKPRPPPKAPPKPPPPGPKPGSGSSGPTTGGG